VTEHTQFHSGADSWYSGAAAVPRYLLLSQARKGDYLSKIAQRGGVSLEQFMHDNAAQLDDLSKPVVGKRLLVCSKRQSPVAPVADPRKESVVDGGSCVFVDPTARHSIEILIPPVCGKQHAIKMLVAALGNSYAWTAFSINHTYILH